LCIIKRNMAFLAKPKEAAATWRPLWLRNLEQDLAVQRSVENYVMKRGVEFKQHKEGPGWKPTQLTEAEDSKKEKPLWNNPTVSPTKVDKRLQYKDVTQEDRDVYFRQWEEKKIQEKQERLLVQKDIEKDKEYEKRSKSRGSSHAHSLFCDEKNSAVKLKRLKEKMEREAMDRDWQDRILERKQKVQLLKIKNREYRQTQKMRTKHGPPGSRKRPKPKKKAKFFTEEKSKSAKFESVLEPKDESKRKATRKRSSTSHGRRKRTPKLSTDDIAHLYRLSVSPLVNPPPRPDLWEAIRPTSAPKGMPRFLQRLEATTDAPPDMRPSIKKALRSASSKLDIKVRRPRYETPDHMKSPEEKRLKQQRKNRKKLLSVKSAELRPRSSDILKSPGGKRAYQKNTLTRPKTPEAIVHESTIELLGDVMHAGLQDAVNNPEREAAALRIQQVGRQRAAKKRVEAVREQKRIEREQTAAATQIQKISRQKKAKKRVEKIRQDKREEAAAIKIQNVGRKNAAKKRVEGLKEERRQQTDAAIKIQSLRRQAAAKERVKQRREEHNEQVDAAIKIQNIGRQKAAKRRVDSLRQQKARMLPVGYEEVALVQSVFDIIDPSHNGSVSRATFMKAIQLNGDVQGILAENKVLKSLMNPAKAGMKWKEMDVNEDDHISMDEMVNFAASIQED
jgi:hypothetical protein